MNKKLINKRKKLKDILLERFTDKRDFKEDDKFSLKWFIADIFESYFNEFEDFGFSIIFVNSLIVFSLFWQFVFKTNLIHLLLSNIFSILVYFIVSHKLISNNEKKNDYSFDINYIEKIKLFTSLITTFVSSAILCITSKKLEFILLFIFVVLVIFIDNLSMKIYNPALGTKIYDKCWYYCKKIPPIKLFISYIPISHFSLFLLFIFLIFNLFGLGIISITSIIFYIVIVSIVISKLDDSLLS